jgi:acetoacetate decarboxylase
MVQSLVPAPLKPVGPDLIIQQHRNTIAQPVLYHYPNANVIVPVMFGETSGFYMARVYEGSYDATTLTIWGREIWGFPKIAAETDAVREGNRASSYVRAGHATVSVALSLENTTQTEPAATLLLYCRKTIPSVDGQGLDLDRIVEVPWRHTPEERVPGEVKFCAVNLDLAGKSVKLPVTEYADAFWFTQEPGSILDKGKVVHDYLA